MREARAGGKNGRPDVKAQWQGTRELMSALSGLNLRTRFSLCFSKMVTRGDKSKNWAHIHVWTRTNYLLKNNDPKQVRVCAVKLK